MAGKKGLGRGLESLFEQNTTEDGSSTVMLKISDIEPNSLQPRKYFNEEAIAELADSISQHGVIQPLLVRPIFGGGYQIVAGERRWRASRMAGISEVPVVIRELSDMETMEIALVENLQREDLNPIEEAKGYKQLMDTYEMTQQEVSDIVGKSRPTVANALRLLNLPEDIIDKVGEGVLSSAQARTLLAFEDIEQMKKAAELAQQGQLTVRDLELMAKKSKQPIKEKSETEKVTVVPYFKEVEISMTEYLGRRVKIKADKKNKGTLEIEFFDKDDLTDLLKYFEENQERG